MLHMHGHANVREDVHTGPNIVPPLLADGQPKLRQQPVCGVPPLLACTTLIYTDTGQLPQTCESSARPLRQAGQHDVCPPPPPPPPPHLCTFSQTLVQSSA